MAVITELFLETLPLFKKGKVRSVFDFGEQLLIVASDRVSAFDYILNKGVPQKGQVLTTISNFWFETLSGVVENHKISINSDDFPEETRPYKDILEGRSMLVKKTELIEFECVVRGYIVGSGWKEYQKTGTVCGLSLPSGLILADKLPEPIFTPATKALDGDHDENVSFDVMSDSIGLDLASKLRGISISLYKKASEYAAKRGIILADTKFEFGLLNGNVILIDEALTPDSSRFWSAEEYQPGISPPSFDKQIVRDYLESTDWDKNSTPPELPDSIIQKASRKYLEIQEILTQTC
jgi:phosphoribosylaminoimidazole-succinocarboxamide synthase